MSGASHHRSSTTICRLMCVLAMSLGCRSESSPAPRHEKESSPRATISGIVRDQDRPLADARVRFKGATDFVRTTADGRFQLAAPESMDDVGHVITAALPGYIIGSAHTTDDPIAIQLRAIPAHDNPEYAWVDPTPDAHDAQRCGNCHHAIYDQWRDGAHGMAGSNRHFLDLYTGHDAHAQQNGWGLLTEYPEGAGVCAACHLPAAPIDQLGVADIRDITGTARLGVHCDFCHKIESVDVSSVGLTHGRFAMSVKRPSHGQLFFGPLDDVDRDEDSYLPLLSRSQFCAPCHEGVVFGVPVYTTYSEWLNSPARAAGKQCQSCHMKPDGELTNIAEGFGGIERHPDTLASHRLLPGGRLAMLQNCLDIQVRMLRQDEQITIIIETSTHNVGHRVPTGFIDRHLMLIVEGVDADGQPVRAMSGSVLPSAAGDLANRSGVLFAKLLKDDQDQAPVPFWRAGVTPIDTRLIPDATRQDRFAYPLPLARLRVRLVYRRFWQATSQSKGWDDTSLTVIDRSIPVDVAPISGQPSR